MTTVDITGTWRGFYVQYGERHGITMRVTQDAASVCGERRDDDVFLAQHFDRIGEETTPASEPPVVGHAEVLIALPERSTIVGTVHGDRVRLVSTYDGTVSTSTWVVDAALVGLDAPGYHQGDVRPGHSVHYRGRLDASGDLWCGHWLIRSDEPDCAPLRDRFELRRVARS